MPHRYDPENPNTAPADDFVRWLTAGGDATTIENYVLRGMTSHALPPRPDGSMLRVFHMTERQVVDVVPHSHRFGFSCLVLRGTVENVIYRTAISTVRPAYGVLGRQTETVLLRPDHNLPPVDRHVYTSMYLGTPGSYKVSEPGELTTFYPDATTYKAGEWYSMEASEIHDIRFSYDAVVLFLEGPPETDVTITLGPPVVEPWMFRRVGGGA